MFVVVQILQYVQSVELALCDTSIQGTQTLVPEKHPNNLCTVKPVLSGHPRGML